MTIAVMWDGQSYSCTPCGCTLLTEPQPEPDPEVAPVRVVAYSQRDSRWANQIYAGDATFAQAGCLVTCVAMIASLAYADAPLPPDVAQALRAANAFSGAFLSRPSAGAEG